MRRKIIAIALALLLVAGSLAATPWFQIGLTSLPWIAVGSEDYLENLGDIDCWSFGPEIRLNLFNWVSLAIPGYIQTVDDSGEKVWNITTIPSLNLNLPVASWLDIALGAAVPMRFSFDDGRTYLNYIDMDSVDWDRYLDITTLHYRGAVTFNLGPVGLGLAAYVPTGGSLSDIDFAPNWEGTQVSASVLIGFGD